MNRNLYISTLAFKKYPIGKTLKLIKKNNLDGIDLAPLTIFKSWSQFENNLFNLKKKLTKNKIKINAMQGILFGWNTNLFYSSKVEILRITLHIKKIIRICKFLKIKKIIIGSSHFRKKRGMSLKKSDEKFIAFFSQFKIYLEKNNVTLCLEAIPKKYGEDYIYKFDHLVRLIKKLNSKKICINFDTSLFHYKKFNFKFFYKYRKIIKNLQISQKYFKNFNKISSNNLKFSRSLKPISNVKDISLEMILDNPSSLEINKSIRNFKKYFKN